ncbi:hypothetical protein DUNSADRAFT_7831 [Dunaliella salina]|uniref:Encoded protein n=1 Tax=Dunaliella salina TaxID=3046 RepID=A0ABQ7GKN3_DUNSA|nr:hypothetical protein DUNSADRAFT_7831 [Dunaliella salina]|eukprot:KAF5835156.1 hypothetical protein DUNSADRAFT_7831 [Dunaliella salina]
MVAEDGHYPVGVVCVGCGAVEGLGGVVVQGLRNGSGLDGAHFGAGCLAAAENVVSLRVRRGVRLAGWQTGWRRVTC